MARNILLIIILAAFSALVGCNTMEGFGKDVSKVGDKIEDTAEKVKK